jgi:hypothetical protein
MGSQPFSLNADDFRSLGWSILDVATAAAATEFIQWSASLETNHAITITLVGVATVLVKAGRKWIADNRKRWQS